MPSENVANFSVNLRFLCDRHGSISAVCRELDLNRQQFNKYLSGHHVPSAQNLRLIANFFGLSVRILFSAPEELRTLVEGNFFATMDAMRTSPHMGHFFEKVIVGSGDGVEFVGRYDRYQFSSIYRGQVLRSAFCIFRNRDLLQHCYVERFPNADAPSKTDYVFKYHGFVWHLSDRLFTTDFETIQRNEVTFGIFAPLKRSSNRFMFGLTSGISATMFRQPFSTRVALHYRGPGLLSRRHLRAATLLDPADPSIPREVLRFLGDGSDMLQLI